MRCDAIRYEIRYDTMRYETIKYITMRYDMLRYDTITTRCTTIQYNTIRYEATQYKTIHCLVDTAELYILIKTHKRLKYERFFFFEQNKAACTFSAHIIAFDKATNGQTGIYQEICEKLRTYLNVSKSLPPFGDRV